MMSFLVQDFLDYAQIKSGKFRTNIHPFNLRETIRKVVNIQIEKARSRDIELNERFTINGIDSLEQSSNKDSTLQDTSTEMFSTLVYSDEQRLIQVLLNLQSNALKFT